VKTSLAVLGGFVFVWVWVGFYWVVRVSITLIALSILAIGGDVPSLGAYMYMLSVFWGFWFCCSSVLWVLLWVVWGWGVGCCVVVFLCFDLFGLSGGVWCLVGGCLVCVWAWVAIGTFRALRQLRPL